MADIRPYKINVPEDKIKRVKQKLALVEYPPEIEDEEPWVRGVPVREAKRLIDYWSNEFDWRKTEARLNRELSQYTTDIAIDNFDTFTVHFVHQQSKVPNAIPLLFLHGWPGNFTEAEKIIPLLISGDGLDTPAFHVVAPSLINFGFSDRATKKGFSLDQHAHAYHTLMLRLGYQKYTIQAGDLGAFTARVMVQHFPSSIAGHLLNLTTPREPTHQSNPALHARWQQHTTLTPEEQAGMTRNPEVLKTGMAYYQIQATKPQTISYGMSDSPLALLTWLYEKLHDWTDAYPWTPDEILTWVSIYLFSTGSTNATQQIYYESTHTRGTKDGNEYSGVPLG